MFLETLVPCNNKNINRKEFMQPEENVQNEAVSAVAPVMAPKAPKKDNPSENTLKKSNAVLIVSILCLILAVGGIAFGVWEMMDGNAQMAKKDEQIKELNSQISLLKQEKEELEAQIESISGLSNSDDVSVSDENYVYLDELGIKLKKTDAFPDLVAKKADDEYTIYYLIKRSSEIQDTASVPDSISLTKESTCNPAEITKGFGALLNVGGDCYTMGEILPYGSDTEHPLTDFLKYVSDQENYSKI